MTQIELIKEPRGLSDIGPESRDQRLSEAEDRYYLGNWPFIVRGFQGVRGEPTGADEMESTV